MDGIIAFAKRADNSAKLGFSFGFQKCPFNMVMVNNAKY
jgi:hypothetical protein